MTNSPKLQEQIDFEEENPKPKSQSGHSKTESSDETYAEATLPTHCCNGLGEQKVLGLRWNVQHDQLGFDLRGLTDTAMRLEPTKRNVISLIGKRWDFSLLLL